VLRQAHAARSIAELLLPRSLQRKKLCKSISRVTPLRELRPILQQTMWETLLVEKGRRITISRKKLQLRRNLNAWPAMFLSLSITEAASMRTESRDSHFRADNPRRDDANWLTNVFVTRKNGHLSLFRKWAAEADRCGRPAGRRQNQALGLSPRLVAHTM